MPTIKTIKPAGGGDYTTLAAWEIARQAAGMAAWWAEVYSGGTVGAVTLGFTDSVGAANFVKIYAAVGHQHNGTFAQAANSVAQTDRIAADAQAFLQLVGLRLTGVTGTVDLSAQNGDQVSGIVCDSLLVDDSIQAISGGPDDSNSTLSVTIVNCAAKSAISASANAAFSAGDASGANVVATVANCTADSFVISVDSDAGVGGAHATVTWTNLLAKTGFLVSNTGTGSAENTINRTSDYLLSGNASAATYATHNLSSQTMANVLTNVTTDYSIPSGSPARNAGTPASVAYDIIGTSRPRGVAWDIGAFEFIEAVVGPKNRMIYSPRVF